MSFPLHEAAREKNAKAVDAFLEEFPKRAFEKDLDGRTALHWAVTYSNKDIVATLLNFKKELELDDLSDDSGWTPVQIAASVGDPDILELLLSHEPEPDANLQVGSNKVTALHLATSKQHYLAAKKLLDHGASARIKDGRQQTPIFRAAASGSVKLVQLLAKQGKAQLNIKDVYGWTPMHHALAEGFGDVAVELVKLGADPEVEDAEGKKPVDVSVDDKVKEFFKKGLEL